MKIIIILSEKMNIWKITKNRKLINLFLKGFRIDIEIIGINSQTVIHNKKRFDNQYLAF